MKKGTINADKFSTYFDQDWGNTRSKIRTRAENRRTYDVSNSWDARSDNPESFSRLNQTLVPYQPTVPIVLSGTSVIKLEDNVGCDTLNVKQNKPSSTYIPLSIEQQDVQMNPDLSATISIKNEAKLNSKVVVVDRRDGFENMNIKAPQLKDIDLPEYVVKAGREADQALLNPKQRRELNNILKAQQDAENLMKKAEFQRNKLRKQMAGPNFRRGILMVDSADNINSEIFGEKAREKIAEDEYKEQIHLERMSRLANKQSSMTTCGNILNPETLGPRVKLTKDYQSKGGYYHALSFDETHNRLFCRLQGSAGSQRTQQLRDIELSGKDYNIVNHTLIEHWPPRNFERQIDKNMAHPSQHSVLEQSRNLQGTIRPY